MRDTHILTLTRFYIIKKYFKIIKIIKGKCYQR